MNRTCRFGWSGLGGMVNGFGGKVNETLWAKKRGGLPPPAVSPIGIDL